MWPFATTLGNAMILKLHVIESPICCSIVNVFKLYIGIIYTVRSHLQLSHIRTRSDHFKHSFNCQRLYPGKC